MSRQHIYTWKVHALATILAPRLVCIQMSHVWFLEQPAAAANISYVREIRPVLAG